MEIKYNRLLNMMVKAAFPFAYKLFNDRLVMDFFKSLKWLVFAQAGALGLFLVVYNYSSVIGIFSDMSFLSAGESPKRLVKGSVNDGHFLLSTSLAFLLMVLGGVIGVVGSIRIYHKWNDGDDDINRELIGFGGTTVFLLFAPFLLRALIF